MTATGSGDDRGQGGRDGHTSSDLVSSDHASSGRTGSGHISPEDRAAIRQRSSELGKGLDAVKARRVPVDAAAAKARGQAYGQAMRIAAELVAGVAVGGFIGWVLDRQFGTTPWLLIVFVIFGFAAGLLNVIRTAKRMQAEAEPLQRAAIPAGDGDDED